MNCKIFAAAMLLVTTAPAFGANGNVFNAIKEGDIDALTDMLESDKEAVVKARLDNGLSPLHLAANLDEAEAVFRLLVAGMDPDTTVEGSGTTPLMMAVSRGATDSARILLSRGADPNSKTRNGNTALHFLANTPDANPAFVKILTKNSVVNKTGKNADINAVDSRGHTPLQIATERDNAQIVSALVKNGAGQTPTRPATSAGAAAPTVTYNTDAAVVPNTMSIDELYRRLLNDPTTIRNNDGSLYRGELRNGKPHGMGLLMYDNRERYDGNWVNGKRHGVGTYVYANRNSLAGDWRNNVPDGPGVFVFANGDKIRGIWKSGAFIEGAGEFTGNNGKKYSGKWSDSRLTSYNEI